MQNIIERLRSFLKYRADKRIRKIYQDSNLEHIVTFEDFKVLYKFK